MYQYGQYCPIAKAVEILGDRWTLLIVRDLLTGSTHFNQLERGLPGISRGLLSERLSRLERVGIVEKVHRPTGRRRTAYHLTEAGRELQDVINALLAWGVRWAFEEPEAQDLDPLLLMWWMHDRVRLDLVPEERVVIRFDFTGAKRETYWLLLTPEEASICLTDPGFDLNILVTADLSTFFQIWMGRISFAEAARVGLVRVDGIPRLADALPSWLAYSLAAPAVRDSRDQ